MSLLRANLFIIDFLCLLLSPYATAVSVPSQFFDPSSPQPRIVSVTRKVVGVKRQSSQSQFFLLGKYHLKTSGIAIRGFATMKVQLCTMGANTFYYVVNVVAHDFAFRLQTQSLMNGGKSAWTS